MTLSICYLSRVYLSMCVNVCTCQCVSMCVPVNVCQCVSMCVPVNVCTCQCVHLSIVCLSIPGHAPSISSPSVLSLTRHSSYTAPRRSCLWHLYRPSHTSPHRSCLWHLYRPSHTSPHRSCPSHTSIAPHTRLLTGPVPHTPLSQVLSLPDGKYVMPASCPTQECRGRAFVPDRTAPETQTVDFQVRGADL